MAARKRVEGDTPRHTAIIDWDGTAVPAMWPERPTEFMPGFVRNMQRLHEAGWKLVISSARISPWDPWTSMRRPVEHQAAEIQYIRDMLDSVGLTYIDIWVKEGKPGGDVYVDDKAERYTGSVRAWDRVTDKILLRAGEPIFPAFDQGADE
jgi:hypothetical protein